MTGTSVRGGGQPSEPSGHGELWEHGHNLWQAQRIPSALLELGAQHCLDADKSEGVCVCLQDIL